MEARHDDFCRPGSVFFDRDTDDATYASVAPVPDGWLTGVHGPWRLLRPPGATLPAQGWKVHVSCLPASASLVLGVVHAYCAGRGTVFKHLRSPLFHRRSNGKYTPRDASGKFIAIYPASDTDLAAVLPVLSELLAGVEGPYILSDLRIGDGPVHVRYGAFHHLDLDDGEQTVPAIRRPDGSLVPDVRKPRFSPPAWVVPPAVLRPHLGIRRGGSLPFRITAALHFSNGGGVYRAVRADGQEILVKEGRPHAAIDAYGHDAVDRLRHEFTALRALEGIPGLPSPYGLHDGWEHLFLARELLPGIPLGRWMARNYPQTAAGVTTYRDRAMAVADRLDQIVTAIHDHGWTVGDLHPRNVLVAADDTVSLIDLETATPQAAGPGIAAMGAPGFRAPAGVSGVAADRYALAAVRLWLMVPLAPVTELDPAAPARHLAHAHARFVLPAAVVDRLRSELCDDTRVDRPPESQGAGMRAGLVRAILASATPERDDRLYPGDVEQFSSGGTGFGYGAAGVLYALHRAGVRPPAEHLAWLVRHAADMPSRPGFWTGGQGVAYVLDLLGHQRESDALLARCAPAPDRPIRPGLAGGATGIALSLLSIGERRGDHRLVERAATLAGQVAALPPDAAAGPGLLRGWSGAALLFTRLYEVTGEGGWLDHAEEALVRDLVTCEAVPGAGLSVRDGTKLLPYLDRGSAGLALAAARIARHRPACAALGDLADACRHAFVIYPGLLSGRAGLIAALSEIDPAAARAQLPELALYEVPYAGGIAYPGVTLRRLSMDLHTGTAGVLLAAVMCGEATPHHPSPMHGKDHDHGRRHPRPAAAGTR